jgi:sec-independent protein translocase protein TatA
MIGKLGMPELLVILVIAVLIFGPSKLSSLGKSLGEGIRGFKSAVNEPEDPPKSKEQKSE